MKRILFSIMLLATACVSINAEGDIKLTFSDMNIEAGQTADMTVSYQFDRENVYQGYEFHLYLPDGLSLTTDSRGRISYTKGDCYDGHTITANYKQTGLDEGDVPHYVFICYSADGYPLTGTNGTLLTIPVQAADNVAAGELKAQVKGIVVQDQELADQEVTFTVSAATAIGEVRDSRTDASVFDLSGRRTMTSAKGLYVIKGRKVVVK